MKRIINIMVIVISLNILFGIFLYANINKNEKISYINYEKSSYYEKYFSKIDMDEIFLENIKVNDVVIKENETYDVSMFIDNYEKYNDYNFKIINNKTYTKEGQYIIKIILNKNDYKIARKASLTITKDEVIENPEIALNSETVNDTGIDYNPVLVNNQSNTNNIKTESPKNTTPKQNNNAVTVPSKPQPEPEPTPETVPTPEPEPVPEPEPEPVIPGTYDDNYSYQLLNVINEHRINNGLQPFEMDYNLVNSAKTRSYEASIYWLHYRPDGNGFQTAIPYGYIYVGENLAYTTGYASQNDLLNAWLNSLDHAANINNPSFTRTGLATYVINGYYYYAQIFSD